jgi:hypothetical protein
MKNEGSSAAGALDAINAKPDPAKLVDPVPMRSLAKGKLYPFTPAETPNRPDRSVTVAVRVDPQTVREISVRAPKGLDSETSVPLRIAPTAFNLGVSRGYRNFSQSLIPPADSRKPDLADTKFNLPAGTAAEAPRFNGAPDDKHALAAAPRAFGDNEDQVDVGGSLKVTPNLDVTAGVRYSQERYGLRPLTDGKQDSQAVYVGTQFRF